MVYQSTNLFTEQVLETFPEHTDDSPFGLGGSVVTKDPERGKRIAAQMDTGMVFINDTIISGPDLPFGGVKNSGLGRELSDLGMHVR